MQESWARAPASQVDQASQTGRLLGSELTSPEELSAVLAEGHHTWGYLRIPGFALLLLAIAYAIHVVWWRGRVPGNQNGALLALFGIVLVGGLALMMSFPRRLHPVQDFWELLLFLSIYVPVALAYVSLYSIIEEESPSVALIQFLAHSSSGGRSEEEVRSIMNGTGEALLARRLEIMVRDGLITQSGDGIALTSSGLVWARVFDFGARVIGLGKGA